MKNTRSEKSCDYCGTSLVWEHPDVPGLFMESSEYEPTFPGWCHTCLAEHCIQTNCLKCELRKYPMCEFLETKKIYLED